MQPERRRDKGPLPKPRWVPVPELLYAQVVKSYRDGASWASTGDLWDDGAGSACACTCGRKINTAFVERLNLDIRQRVAAVGRRVNTLCQGEDGIRQQLTVYHAYYNFCLPHSSLRPPLPFPNRPMVGVQRRCGAVHTGDGGGLDGSRVVAERGSPLSRATVAAASGKVTGWRSL